MCLNAEPSAGDHDGPAATPVGCRDLGIILADGIAHADSLAAALEGVLSAVGKYCGWAQGEAWLVDEAGRSLWRGPSWSAAGQAFSGTEHPDPARLAPGEGFPGRKASAWPSA